MTPEIGPLPPIQPAAGRRAAELPARPAAVGPAPVDTVHLSLPPYPPAEALDAVAVAAERAEQLWADRRELHFRTDEGTGRVVVEVRDLEGNVIRTIPPSQALDVLGGAAL